MTIKIISKDNDLLGTDLYRDDNAVIPMAYRATIEHSVKKNASGTNHQVTVNSKRPVVNVVNNISTSTDAFMAVTKFSALQHITNDEERAKTWDDHLRFCIVNTAAILAGQLPDAPAVIPTAGTVKIA